MKSFVLLLMTFFSINLANSQSEDGCDAVLRLASRDVNTAKIRANTAKYIYENYCEGSDIKSNLNISFVKDDLFESFNFGLGSSKEKIRQVCQTYESNYKQLVEQDLNSSIVVREAIDAWEECQKLSNRGIKIRPQILQTRFVVDIERSGDDIIVNGVDYDKDKCECKAKIKDGDEEMLVVLDENSRYTINNGDTWNIRCSRKEKNIGDLKYFPEFDFLIPTTEGTFTLNFPKSIQPQHNWISEIMKEIESLKANQNSSNNEIKAQLDSISSKFGKVEFRQECVDRRCNIDNFSRIKTPEGYKDTGIRITNTYPGGRCGKGTHCTVFMKILE